MNEFDTRLDAFEDNLLKVWEKRDDNPMCAALVQWINAASLWAVRSKPNEKQSSPEPVKEWWKEDPSSIGRRSKSNQSENDQKSKNDSLLTDTLELMSLVFRLHPKAACDEMRIRTLELAKRIRETTKHRDASIETLVQEARILTDKIERCEEELVSLQKTEFERQEQLKTKQSELAALRSRNLSYEKEESEILREMTVLDDKLKALDNSQNELDQKRILLQERQSQVGDFKQSNDELDQELKKLENEWQTQKDRQANIQSKIEQTKRNSRQTHKLIEELESGNDPELLRKITQIWETLPPDKLDNDINLIKN